MWTGFLALGVMSIVVLGIAGILPERMRLLTGHEITRLGLLTTAGGPGRSLIYLQKTDGSYHLPRPLMFDAAKEKYKCKIGKSWRYFDAGGPGSIGGCLSNKIAFGYTDFGVLVDAARTKVGEKAKEDVEENGLLARVTRDGKIREIVGSQIPQDGIINPASARFLDVLHVTPRIVETAEEHGRLSQIKFRQMSPLMQGMLIIVAVIATMIFTWWIVSQSGGAGAGAGGGGGPAMPSLPIGMMLGGL